MHILLVSIAFPPKKDPECLQTAKYFKYLVRQGVDVTVVTSSIPTLNMDYDESLIKYDNGYLQKLEYPLKENKYINFIIRKFFPAYLQTPDSKKKFVKNWKKVVVDIKRKPDVIYSRSFPLSSALTALKIKEYYNVPWIMHISDPWADAPWMVKEHGIYEKNRILEKECYEKADKISFTTEKTYDFYCKLYPNYKDKFVIFPNVYDPDEIEENQMQQGHQKLRIVYTGGMSGNRGPQYIINVIEHLRTKGFDVDNKIDLILAGEVDRKNKAIIEEMAHPYLQYVGSKTYNQARDIQKSSHLLLIIEEPLKDTSKAMFFPSKILDYLMARRKMFAITSANSQVDITFKKLRWDSYTHEELDEAALFLKSSFEQINNFSYFYQHTIPDDFNAQKNAERLISLMKNTL